jgi:hypothetical protein
VNSSQTDKTLDFPPRPHLGEASAGALLGAIALGLLTRDWTAAIAGGAIGAGLANKKQPLEFAIREYFKAKGLEVVFFYRAPRLVKVTFRYADNAFWTVESVMPDDLILSSDEARDDWLYGSLIKKELPKILRKIRQLQTNESR